MILNLCCKFIPLLMAVCLLPGTASADLRSNARAWLDAYDLAPASTPRLDRVHSIFKQVKRVARGADLRVKLYVVNSDNEPWAVALQDGNIILSRGAIDIIYDGVDLASSDARMAFVLGHELAHIVANDFWHQQVYASFLESGNAATQRGQNQYRRKEQELRADEEGFLYASLAGFATTAIFTTSGSDKNFLHYWTRQTRSIPGGSYHTTDERVRFLQSRLSDLETAVEFFKYGVRLAHFGRYEDAKILLEEFYGHYPSRQVLSSLGYVYVQLARKKMPPELAYRFWYPTLLEYDAGVPTSTRSIGSRLPQAAQDDLLVAVEFLEAGTAMDMTDLTGRINLIAAYLYLGDFDAALLMLKEAMEGRDKNPQLLALKALVIMENKSSDKWGSEVRKLLEDLASTAGADDNIIYNYARLLEDRGRHGAARTFWRRLATNLPGLPVSYQYMICKHIEKEPACQRNPDKYGVRAFKVKPVIEPGVDIDSPKAREILKAWGAPVVKQIAELDTTIFRHPNGDSVLAIDGIIELVTLAQHGYSFKQQLRKEHGSPLVEIPIGSDHLWSYGSEWSALVRGEEVEEIWLAQ